MMYDQRVIPSHTFLGKTFHWCFIILYAYGIFKQLDDISQLEDKGLLVFEVAFASIFLLIVILRYSYMRKFGTFIGANEPIPMVHELLARSIHVSMYLCLILLPLSGLAIAGLFSLGVVEGKMQSIALLVHEFSADLSYSNCTAHHSSIMVTDQGRWGLDLHGPHLQGGRPLKERNGHETLKNREAGV